MTRWRHDFIAWILDRTEIDANQNSASGAKVVFGCISIKYIRVNMDKFLLWFINVLNQNQSEIYTFPLTLREVLIG